MYCQKNDPKMVAKINNLLKEIAGQPL
ncbi:MAG: hypothetical protein IT272_07035 [Chitinophagales bacterium]|nr:hypothetical protein [Chitinophagales bacterium]MCC7057149.1 hypothetical protein [Chitinophagales bacterium]MDA0197601.1 hypothetical protein [Bacteroidota bacterium]